MPPVEGKIRLCSNLLREPQVFDQLGELAGGIARDLLIWAAWNNTPHAVLHLPQFCEMMGYRRQYLLAKLLDNQVGELKERGWHEEDVPLLSNRIGYALGKMATQLLLFAEERLVLEPGKYHKKSRRYTTKRMVNAVNIEKRSTGTLIRFEVDPEVIENCRERYQTLNLAHYISLKTPGGHPDDQARKMYLRLVWKRQYWDSQPVEPDVNPSKDSYRELKAVAGLQRYSVEKRAASELRQLLKRIGKLASIQMKPTVELNYALGVYEVSWARGRMNKKKKAEADTVAVAA